MIMDKKRKQLIDRFQRWFDTNPNPEIMAAECANIAEGYAKNKITKKHLEQAVAYGMGVINGKHNLNMTEKDIIRLSKEGAKVIIENYVNN